MPMTFPVAILRTLVALAAVASATETAAAPPTISFSELRSGMKGVGKTVFRGETIESFDVEIVGLLPNIGPGQDLILGRCTGGPLAQTGILAGMSGSPVFVDGKLIGAVAYSWGFSKDAIAGITPIAEMFAVGARDAGATTRSRPARSIAWNEAVRLLDAPGGVASYFASRLDGLVPPPAGATAITPLAIAGLGSAGLARVAPELTRAGFLPVQASASGTNPASPTVPLQPGSAVGVKLVRGDVEMTATGTVTWIDGDSLYAFGHPLYGLGEVDLPLTAARVETLLPSLESSSKIAVPLKELGAFRQDRASAIFGRLGATPAMIPVRLQLSDGSGIRHAFSFDIADDALLTPLLFYAAVNGVLGTVERTFGSATIRIREGSVIKLDGVDDIRLDNLFAGERAAGDASGLSAFLLYLLMNNDWSPPHVRGINVILDYEPEPRTATVRRVTLDRYRVKAGSSLTARVLISPYRGPDVTLTREIEIPEETAPGPLTLQVGSAGPINRADDVDGPIYPRDLDQLVFLINRLRKNDRVYIIASRGDAGAFLGGARLPNLPPSVTTLLTRPRSWGNYAFVPERGVLEEEIPVDAALDGFARIAIDVEAP